VQTCVCALCVCGGACSELPSSHAEVLLPGHVSPCCNEAITDAPRQHGTSQSPRMHPRLAVIYGSPRDPRVCWGKGPGWEAACSCWELPLAPWVPCNPLLLPLEAAEECSPPSPASLGGHPEVTPRGQRSGGREGWAGPGQADAVVQAQPCCIKARAGAE